MTDKTVVVHMGENSPEHVAFKLLERVASIEKRNLHGSTGNGETPADRKWLLDTYAECIRAVTVPLNRSK